jgi:hypothetical protein
MNHRSNLSGRLAGEESDPLGGQHLGDWHDGSCEDDDRAIEGSSCLSFNRAETASRASGTPQQQQQQQQQQPDRLDVVGVIGDDQTIRLQVLSTPSPPPSQSKSRLSPLQSPLLPTPASGSNCSLSPSSRLVIVDGRVGDASRNILALAETGHRHLSRRDDPTRREPEILGSASSTTNEAGDDGGLASLREASVIRQRVKAETVRSVRCRLAGLAARVSRENLEREASFRAVQIRAHEWAETRLVDPVLQRQDSACHETRTALHALDRRLMQLDPAMTRALHQDASDSFQEQIGSLWQALDGTLTVQRNYDEAEASRTGATFRTLDRMAGDMRRRVQEERSVRIAATEMAGSQIREQFEWDPRTEGKQHLLDRILDLRRQVQSERCERLQRDASLRQEIRRATLSMKRALLNVVVAENERSGGDAMVERETFEDDRDPEGEGRGLDWSVPASATS